MQCTPRRANVPDTNAIMHFAQYTYTAKTARRWLVLQNSAAREAECSWHILVLYRKVQHRQHSQLTYQLGG